MQKTKTIKADPGNSGDNMGNSSRKGKDSWTNVYDVFSNVLDRNTIQVKNLSETITELDALKNLTQNASTSVLKAVTTFIEGRVRQKKFLSPDQINIQIRKIIDAESLLLETRREVETIDEGLTVDSLREIRKRFSRAVNRSESLSMDIKNDRTLLSELEEAITLALKKARAEVQLSAARKEASSSAHEFEALTTVRRKLLSAIKKAQSVGIDVSSEMSLAEKIQSTLEKIHERMDAQSELQKVVSEIPSVTAAEELEELSRVQHELSSAIERASAAEIDTGDARKMVKDLQKSVSAAKKRVKAKVEAQQVLKSLLAEAKSVSDDSDIQRLRSVKQKIEKAIEEARIWDINVIAEESFTKEMGKVIDAAEEKDQANKQLKAAQERFKSHAISDDIDLLLDIHKEMKSAIHRASRAGIDVTDDRVKARELTLRIGVVQKLNEARNQLENARKKSEKVPLDASSRTLQRIAKQLSSAIELAQASGMDEQKGYFGATLLKPDHDRLEKIIDAINFAKQKESAQRQLSLARKKATTLPNDSSEDSIKEVREELLKAIDNADKAGIEVSERMLGSRRPLNADQRLLDNLEEAEEFANKVATVRKKLSFLAVEVQSLDENADIGKLQELSNDFKEAVMKGTALGLKVSGEKKLLNDLNGVIDLSEKRMAVISELTEVQELVRSMPKNQNLESQQILRDRFERAVNSARSLNVDTTDAQTQLSALNSEVRSATDQMAAEVELKQAQEMADSLSNDASRGSLVKARERLVTAAKWGKTAGINISGGYFGKSVITVAEDKINDLAKDIELLDHRTEAKKHLFDIRKEAKSLDLEGNDESLLRKVCDNMSSALEKAINVGISTDEDEKLLIELEQAFSKLIREKSDASKALESSLNNAESASVGEELDKLKEIRENLISAIFRAVELGLDITANKTTLGKLTGKIEKTRERTKAESKLHSIRSKVKDNLSEPRLKTLLTLRMSLSTAIGNGELVGLDVSRDKALSSDLEAAIAIARERNEVEANLNSVRSTADSTLPENGSTAVKAIRDRLKETMVQGDSLGVDLRGDSERLKNLAVIIDQAEERESALNQLKELKQEAEAASGDEAKLEECRDKLISSIERCTAAGVGEVSSENLLVDKLNQEITDIRERANAVIELRDALHALDEDSSNLNLEVLTSKRDRLSAAIDCAKLSAIDVSNEMDKLNELENSIHETVENTEAELQLSNAKESVNEASSDDDPAVLRSLYDSLEKAVERAEASGTDVTGDRQMLEDLHERIEYAEKLNKARTEAEEVFSGADVQSIEEALHTLKAAMEIAHSTGIRTDKDQGLVNEMEKALQRFADEKADAQEALSAARLQGKALAADSDPETIENARDTLLEAVHQADAAGIDVVDDQLKVDQLDETVKRARERIEAEDQLSKAREDAKSISMDDDPDALTVVLEFLVAAVGRAAFCDINVEQDEKSIEDLEEAIIFAREKKEAEAELAASRDKAESVSVDDGSDRLQEIRENLTSAMERAKLAGVDEEEDDERTINNLTEMVQAAEENERNLDEALSNLNEVQSKIKSLLEDSDLVTLRNIRDQFLQAIMHAESLEIDVSSYQEDIHQLDKAVDKAEEEGKAYEILDESSPHTNLAESYDVFNAGEPVSRSEETGGEELAEEGDEREHYQDQMETYIIDDVNALREFSNPTRKSIVQCLYSNPLSAEEIAIEINFPREKIYYHLKKLLQVNLIFVAETKVIHGISKKKYLNIARSFQISPSLYEAQLFVETGFPIAENPAAMEEQKKPAQSSAHHPMVEKEEFKETVSDASEEEEFIYEAPVEESSAENIEEVLEEAVNVEAAPIIQATQINTIVEKVEMSTEADTVVNIVEEQNIDATVATGATGNDSGAGDEENSLLSSLLKVRSSPSGISADKQIGEGSENVSGPGPSEGGIPLTQSVNVDDKEFLVPEYDLSPEGIDFAVRNARKTDGTMMSIEEKTLLKDHLLSSKQDDEFEGLGDELEISDEQYNVSAENNPDHPLVAFFKGGVLNIYRHLNGYSKAVTFVKSRNKVTFLMAEVRKDGFLIRKAREYKLPFETEDIQIEEFTELIHYIYEQELKKKKWKRYYLGFYSSDYPIEIDFLKVPQMSKNERSLFIGNQIADKFSIKKKNVLIDWLSYGEKSKEVLESPICCIFTDKDVITHDYQFLTERGIQPRYLTSITTLQYNIFQEQYKTSSSGNAILIYFGHKKSRITLVDDWKIVESREMLIGLENFVQAYRDASSSIPEAQEMSYGDICNVLFQSDLPASKDDLEEMPDDDIENATSSGTYDKILNSVTSQLLSDIYATLRNFNLKGHRMSSNIYANGPGTAIPNIVEIISSSVGKDIEMLELPMETMIHKDFEGEMSPENRQYFMMNLGLILDPSEKLSLMPKEHKENFKWFLPNRLIQIAVGIVLIFSTLFTVPGNSSMKELQSKIPLKQTELNAAIDGQSEYYTYFKELQAIKGFSAIREYDRTEGRKIIYLLQYLTNSTSNRITMSSITSDSFNNPGDNNEGNLLTLSGDISPPSGDTNIILNNFLYLLRSAEHVANVELIKSMVQNEGALNFSIKVTL